MPKCTVNGVTYASYDAWASEKRAERQAKEEQKRLAALEVAPRGFSPLGCYVESANTRYISAESPQPVVREYWFDYASLKREYRRLLTEVRRYRGTTHYEWILAEVAKARKYILRTRTAILRYGNPERI